MKIKRIIFLIAFFLFSSFLFALPFDMILTGDPILEDLRFLSLETGKPFLSFSPPLAPAEVKNFIKNIDVSALSQPGMEAYERITDRLLPDAPISISFENFTALIDFNVTLEARLRFNDDISWYSPNPNIAPLLSLPVRLHFSDFTQLYIEPVFAFKTEKLRLGNFDINVPSEYDHFDERTPQRAFMAMGGEWWNFQIGRDRLYWGTGHTGSLAFSNAFSYYDFARASFFAPFIKYSVIVNQMPLSLNEKYLDNNFFDINSVSDDLKKTTQRYFYLHRLDISLANRVSIGIMEGLMVGNSPLELRYLNPIILFHSLISWNDYDNLKADPNSASHGDMTGSFLSLEINWNITKAFAVYGQLVVNEFALPAESQKQSNQPPNALGYIAGMQYSHSFNTWGSVFFIEYIYTDPYLYILGTPYASFIKKHHSSSSGNVEFIGYPRDTIAVTLGANFFNKDSLLLSGSFSWICKGEHDSNGITYDYNYNAKESTPSGTPENQFILSLGVQWKILPNLSVYIGLDGIVSHNNNHVSGSVETGGQASLAVSWQYK